jgi:hypothetical protein
LDGLSGLAGLAGLAGLSGSNQDPEDPEDPAPRRPSTQQQVLIRYLIIEESPFSYKPEFPIVFILQELCAVTALIVLQGCKFPDYGTCRLENFHYLAGKEVFIVIVLRKFLYKRIIRIEKSDLSHAPVAVQGKLLCGTLCILVVIEFILNKIPIPVIVELI